MAQCPNRSPSLGACNYFIHVYSCHGVFTERSIFGLNLSRIQIPTGTSVINCNHKNGLMLTCRHVHVGLHCFILTEACSQRLELAHSLEKYLKIDLSVKMPLYWLIMGAAVPRTLLSIMFHIVTQHITFQICTLLNKHMIWYQWLSHISDVIFFIG